MDAATLTGRTLGHHAVLEKIGEGGMGVVYKGRDLRLGRLVALKELSPNAFGDDLARRRRFALEARAASALNHPNIVTVYEVDRADDDLDFIAMVYIDGRTLCEARLVARPDHGHAHRVGRHRRHGGLHVARAGHRPAH